MSTHEGEPETDWERISAFGCGILMLGVFVATAAAVYGIAVWVLAEFLPLWAAALLGLPVVALAFVLWTTGETTIFEKFMMCLQLLILLAVLAPVFQRAKQNADRLDAMRRPALSAPRHQP